MYINYELGNIQGCILNFVIVLAGALIAKYVSVRKVTFIGNQSFLFRIKQ